jgi:hypothetical protein
MCMWVWAMHTVLSSAPASLQNIWHTMTSKQAYLPVLQALGASSSPALLPGGAVQAASALEPEQPSGYCATFSSYISDSQNVFYMVRLYTVERGA